MRGFMDKSETKVTDIGVQDSIPKTQKGNHLDQTRIRSPERKSPASQNKKSDKVIL